MRFGKPKKMKNRTYIGKSFEDLKKKKDELVRQKKMVIGSTGVQWMGDIWVGGLKKWLLIYREPKS